MIASLKTWFIDLSKREQILITILAIMSIFIGGYYLIVSPIITLIDEAKSRHDESIINYGDIKFKTNLLKNQSDIKSIKPANIALALDAYIGQNAAENSIPLGKNILRGDTIVDINITAIRSQPLFSWLHSLEQQGINAQSLTITKNDNGIISADITLSKAISS